jgi:hypothetical protein
VDQRKFWMVKIVRTTEMLLAEELYYFFQTHRVTRKESKELYPIVFFTKNHKKELLNRLHYHSFSVAPSVAFIKMIAKMMLNRKDLPEELKYKLFMFTL